MLEIYGGWIFGFTDEVLKRMFASIYDSGQNVIMDNWFRSLDTVELMMNIKG